MGQFGQLGVVSKQHHALDPIIKLPDHVSFAQAAATGLVYVTSWYSMITRGGLRKTRLYEPEAAYPVTLEGIGKSRVSWAKISNVTVGVGAYMVRFKDIVVKEESDGIEDGILGASFLSPFDVEIRFGAMALVLENPVERHRRETKASPQEIAR